MSLQDCSRTPGLELTAKIIGSGSPLLGQLWLSLYMYIYTHTYIYTYVYVRTYMFLSLSLSLSPSICICKHVCAYMHTYITCMYGAPHKRMILGILKGMAHVQEWPSRENSLPQQVVQGAVTTTRRTMKIAGSGGCAVRGQGC